MKKLLGICISLILIVVAIVPNCVIATASTNGADNIIHFLNPTAIAIVGNNLFVADNIEDNHSAILCFDVSGATPIYKYTHEVNGSVNNLSANGNDAFFAILSEKVGDKVVDKVVEFEVNTNSEITQKSVYEVENAIDVTVGVYTSNANTIYILTTDDLLRITKNGTARITTSKLNNAKGCIALNDSTGKPSNIYHLYNNEVYLLEGADANYAGSLSILNKPSGFEAAGLFVWNNGELGIFTKNSVSYIDRSANASLVALLDYNDEIRDVASQNNKLFILSGKNKIEIFAQTNGAFDLTATIGSETVERAVPTQYTSFTLARSNGYPTNIVYKTTADSSVSELISDADEYIILGFDGDEDCGYYYVLVGNNFGWVKKSDNAETVENDGKIQVINTNVSNDTVDYKTKFNSLNAVYIYELPRENSNYTIFEQSATSMQEVTILQKFTELTQNGEKVWYYVLYGEGELGFVNAESVGRFYLSINSDEIKGIGARKINSTLFSAVKVYATEDLDDNELAYTPEGNEITLYSGQRVFLISEGEGWSFIQIESNDGTTAFGYVKSNRLINVNDITTNAIVGLSLLGVAIVIAIILLTVFVNRKHAKENQKGKDKK